MEEIFVIYVLSLAVGDVQQEIVAARLHFFFFFFEIVFFLNYPLSFHKGMTSFSKLKKKQVKVQRKTLSVSITFFQKFK